MTKEQLKEKLAELYVPDSKVMELWNEMDSSQINGMDKSTCFILGFKVAEELYMKCLNKNLYAFAEDA
jgi:hypothetical protein